MKRFWGHVALLFVAAAGLTTALFAAPAYASETIHATISQGCASGYVMTRATFTLTDVGASQQITVNTLSPHLLDHESYDLNSHTATYSLVLDAPLAAPPAQATVSNWSGSFSLTSRVCAAAKLPKITPSVSLCGMPVVLTIELTNNNPVWTMYTVGLTGRGSQTSQLSKGEDEEITFPSLTRGTDYTLTVNGSDGTRTSQVVKVALCQANPLPGAPVGNKSASPSSKPTLEPTPTASPTIAETPGITTPGNIGAPLLDGAGGTDQKSEFFTLRTTWIGAGLVVLAIIIFAVWWWYYKRRQSTHP